MALFESKIKMYKQLFLLSYVALAFCDKYKLRQTVKQDRLDLTSNKSHIKLGGGLHFYNRTVKAVNLNITVVDWLNPDSIFVVIPYKWINNNYHKYAPIEFHDKLRLIIDTKLFGIRDIFHTNAVPEFSWPFMVNQTYWIQDWIPEGSKFPRIPLGKYRVVVLFQDKLKDPILYVKLVWFITVDQEFY